MRFGSSEAANTAGGVRCGILEESEQDLSLLNVPHGFPLPEERSDD